MAAIIGAPKAQFFDNNGDPLVSGKVYTYIAGSLTPIATYPTLADALALTNANTNPVLLNSRGEANIVIKGSTKFVLKDADSNEIYTVDNVNEASNTVYDENGNELLKFTTVSSAINEFTIRNATTGNGPILSATGDDTNVDINYVTKGSGLHNFTGSLGNTTIGATNTFSLLPAGCVIWFASSTGGGVAPTGWLECDHSAVSRTTYATLFGQIGTTYGVGDGSTTFNLPNQARRVLVGRGGSGSATLAATTGATGGEELHTMTISELVAHTHTQVQSTVATQSGVNQTVLEAASNTSTGSTGSTTPFNVMQPSLVMIMLIRAY